MILSEFKEKILDIESLEKEISSLKKYMIALKLNENIYLKAEKDNSIYEYKIPNRYVFEACKKRFEHLIDSYKYQINELKENGLNIEMSKELLKEIFYV